MKRISVSDCTIRLSEERQGEKLSFKLKLEIARILDRLGVDVIELGPIKDPKTDHLLVKSVASSIESAALAVPVDIADPESITRTWEALRQAHRPRLQLPVPVSTVQMEYFCHRKPEAMLEFISGSTAACASLCPDVEFIACDFGGSDPDFLAKAINAAVAAGAGTVTLADASGDLLPDEFQKYVNGIRGALPADVRLGVFCSNELRLADICSVSAVRGGADEIKATVFGRRGASLERFSRILEARSEACGAVCGIDMTAISHCTEQVRQMCEAYRTRSAVSQGMGDNARYGEIYLTAQDELGAVLKAACKLGYDLTEEDGKKVFEAFGKLAAKGETVQAKELDAIVAAVAFQVPSTYRLESFVTNSGNITAATCHIRLVRDGQLLEGVCIGDGPIDAAFMAIDNVIGRHYELDDFQIRSVTEGREAMGDAVVRLRHCGKVYSGRGVSTDIIASSIMAYLNAVNKIAYEEAQA